MLVLSRKLGESIVVDGDITITLVGIGRGRVQLGVEAPRETIIHREEIFRRIQNENALANRQLACTG